MCGKVWLAIPGLLSGLAHNRRQSLTYVTHIFDNASAQVDEKRRKEENSLNFNPVDHAWYLMKYEIQRYIGIRQLQ